MLTKDTKLRFWCQKVLPLVYDDSLSYYELLNKVVLHLNQNTENINQLIDFYNTFAEDVEDIIHQMMEDGEFNEIVADTIGSLIAEEYDPTKSYIIFDYCIFESKLYRANGSTTGDFDPDKWVERNVGYDLTTIQNYIYSLNAGNVSYDDESEYEAGTVGKEIKDLKENLNDIDAGDVSYDSAETYSNGTVGKELKDLNTGITNLTTDSIATLEAIAYLEDTNVATKRTYQKGEYVYIKQYNRLYKTSDTVPQDTSFVGKIIYLSSGGFNSVIEEGTWTPQLYDENTFLRNFPTQRYWKLGHLYILTINITPTDAFDFTGITTNMVIKGSPCQHLQTGVIFNQYVPTDSNKGKNIQGYNDIIYLRDNLTSADMSTQYNLSFKMIVFGFEN